MEQIQQQLTDIQNRLTAIENAFKFHAHTGLDSQTINGIPSGLSSAPLSGILRPVGGVTQDTFARNAINSIIDDLITLGLEESS